jgi:hypothetical protein
VLSESNLKATRYEFSNEPSEVNRDILLKAEPATSVNDFVPTEVRILDETIVAKAPHFITQEKFIDE